MADPPWDIHMTLPYGTLKVSLCISFIHIFSKFNKDREMKAMRVDLL